jgi:hypothetical protein
LPFYRCDEWHVSRSTTSNDQSIRP